MTQTTRRKPMPESTPGISVGQLMNMTTSERKTAAARLSLEARQALAHLAALGLTKTLGDHAKHRKNDHRKWAEAALRRAHEYSLLIAELTARPEKP